MLEGCGVEVSVAVSARAALSITFNDMVDIINIMSYPIPKLVRHDVAAPGADNLMLDFHSFA